MNNTGITRRRFVTSTAALAGGLERGCEVLGREVLDDHDQPAGSQVTIALYNGTFDKSENAIDRERMIDVSVVDGEGETRHPAAGDWREEGPITLLDLATETAGTYLVGVSTKSRMIELTAEDLDEIPPAGRRMARPDRDHRKVLEHEQWAAAVQGYLASVAFADAQLGRVLNAFEKSEHAKNTIVVPCIVNSMT